MNYPVSLDEIDQWLFDSFGILPGACASTENLRYTTARMVAEALWPKNEKEKEMSNIEKIRQEIERLKKILEESTYYLDNSQQALGYSFALDDFKKFIDSLPEDASCVYDTNKINPTPSVDIEDVARVQFASHAHVFDRKRKAVFDWEQFKEVAGIFYGFGKRDSLPEEKPSEDLDEKTLKTNNYA